MVRPQIIPRKKMKIYRPHLGVVGVLDMAFDIA